MGKFVYLLVGELFVFLKTLRHDDRVVVDVAVGRGPFMCPVVVAVPVGFGEVETCPEALVTEGFHHFAGDVGLGILRERTAWVDGGVGGLLRVEHAKAVVVLRGENDILHARILGGFSPFRWVEMLRVEGFVKVLVISLILVIIRSVSVNPRLVADGPRLHHFPLGVDAPVHHEAKFQVLPLADAVGDNRIGFGELVVGLGEGGYANEAQQCGEKMLFHCMISFIVQK